MQATLMTPPNATWREVIEQAKQNVDVLKQPGVIRNLQNILQTNVSVCSSLGQPFITQMILIYQDMLNVYRCATMSDITETGLLPTWHYVLSRNHLQVLHGVSSVHDLPVLTVAQV